jgi:hypothetical protein
MRKPHNLKGCIERTGLSFKEFAIKLGIQTSYLMSLLNRVVSMPKSTKKRAYAIIREIESNCPLPSNEIVRSEIMKDLNIENKPDLTIEEISKYPSNVTTENVHPLKIEIMKTGISFSKIAREIGIGVGKLSNMLNLSGTSRMTPEYENLIREFLELSKSVKVITIESPIIKKITFEPSPLKTALVNLIKECKQERDQMKNLKNSNQNTSLEIDNLHIQIEKLNDELNCNIEKLNDSDLDRLNLLNVINNMVGKCPVCGGSLACNSTGDSFTCLEPECFFAERTLTWKQLCIIRQYELEEFPDSFDDELDLSDVVDNIDPPYESLLFGIDGNILNPRKPA